jgi:hypothetical protein
MSRMSSFRGVAQLVFALLVVTLAGCAHGQDATMIEVAKSLVPPESEILEVTDNSPGLMIEVGDYWERVLISDGGLGPGLLQAVEDRAGAEGWEERYRCEMPLGTKLGYSRDPFKMDVSVRTEEEPIEGVIRIQRIGDGNPWPPSDC